MATMLFGLDSVLYESSQVCYDYYMVGDIGENDYFTDLQVKTMQAIIECEGDTRKAAKLLSEIEGEEIPVSTVNNRFVQIRATIEKARNTINRAENLKKNAYLRKRLIKYK